jgi:putative ABC transport system permease protein
MNARELARAALRNVRRRPLRNALATLGIALATATLVALLTLSAALQRALVDQVGERPLLTAIQVTAGAARAGEPAKILDGPAADALGRLAGVRESIPIVIVPAGLRSGDRSPSGTVLAMSPRRAPYGLASGRPPLATDANAIVLTDAGMRGLGLTPATAVGQNVSLDLRRGDSGAERKAIALHVVGVTADEIPGLGIVALPLGEDALAWVATGESDMARDLRLAQQAAIALTPGARAIASDLARSRYTAIWVVATAVGDTRQVRRAIQDLGYAAFSSDTASQAVEDIFGLVNAALAAIAAVAFIVAALGVVNAMVTTVSERTIEIGVLKSLGARDPVVERLFLAEAALLGVVGGVAGVVAGWLTAFAAALGVRSSVGGLALEPRLDAGVSLAALAAAVGLGLAGAWLPARRASRLVPAEALRGE